jgi:hypothetical protein
MTRDHLPLTVEQAVTAMQQLINASPRSPTTAEIEAIMARIVTVPPTVPDRVQRIRDAIASIKADEAVLFGGTCDEDDDPRRIEYENRVDAGKDVLDALAAELPMQFRGLADAVALAEIARYWADEELNGSMSHLQSDADPYDHFAARLVVAVLALGERPV